MHSMQSIFPSFPKIVQNDFFIYCKEARVETPKSFYGSFCLGPFDSSQSITIANALRRTLLSELTGLAITSVEIEGALHEYSSLPGVRDSVLDILLNFKEIVLKKKKEDTKGKNTAFFQQIGYLKARGPGVIYASDLRLPPGIQCVDPEQYIATLSDEGILNLKFKIEEGQNYIIQKPNLLSQYNNNYQKNAQLLNNKNAFILQKLEDTISLKKNFNLNLNYPISVAPSDLVPGEGKSLPLSPLPWVDKMAKGNAGGSVQESIFRYEKKTVKSSLKVFTKYLLQTSNLFKRTLNKLPVKNFYIKPNYGISKVNFTQQNFLFNN